MKVFKSKGFTLVEIILVVSILGIVLSIAMTRLKPTTDLVERLDTLSIHKLVVGAIDLWVADNKDPRQRPIDFSSKNSQNRSVYSYISEKYAGVGGTSTQIKLDNHTVTFDKGVLKTSERNLTTQYVFGVIEPLETGGTIKDYDSLLAMNVLVSGDYKLISFK